MNKEERAKKYEEIIKNLKDLTSHFMKVGNKGEGFDIAYMASILASVDSLDRLL